MENNEDNRQYTVIAEAISLIEDYTGVYVTDEGCSFQYMTPEGVKYMLESLLPKEREQMDCVATFWWESGQSRIEVDFDDSPKPTRKTIKRSDMSKQKEYYCIFHHGFMRVDTIREYRKDCINVVTFDEWPWSRCKKHGFEVRKVVVNELIKQIENGK